MKKTLRILTITIFSLMLFQHCQKSDFLVVTGIVRDSLTNEPIPGVNIITPDGRLFISESDGTFILDGVQPGKISLTASYRNFLQYKPSTKSIIISNGRVHKIDFTLSPVPKPEVETGRVSNIIPNSASITGNIKLASDVIIRNYGHCWSYSTSIPSIEESNGHTTFSGLNGEFTFSSNLTGLQKNTIYYVRAYAQTYSGNIIYGNSVAFMTSEFDLISGLIYYFPFSGNYNDISGQGYSVRPDGGKSWPSFVSDRFGNSNSACHFSNLVDIYGYGTPGLNDFSVSLWFYKSTIWENSEQHMFQIGDSYFHDNIFYITQGSSPNNLNCGIRVNNTDYKLSLNTSPTLNAWHHVLAQRKGSELILYIDGILKSSMNCPSDFLPPTGYFNIGAGWLGSGIPQYQQFYGDLDDIRLYDHALTALEIKYLSTH